MLPDFLSIRISVRPSIIDDSFSCRKCQHWHMSCAAQLSTYIASRTKISAPLMIAVLRADRKPAEAAALSIALLAWVASVVVFAFN